MLKSINCDLINIFRSLFTLSNHPDGQYQQDMEKLAKTEWRRDWEYAYYKLILGEKP